MKCCFVSFRFILLYVQYEECLHYSWNIGDYLFFRFLLVINELMKLYFAFNVDIPLVFYETSHYTAHVIKS